MRGRIVTCNAGSSNIKLAAFGASALKPYERTQVATREEALAWIAKQSDVVAVGHRVVHGGRAFAEPVVIDDAILHSLEALIPLAPLHQPHNLSLIRAARSALPEVPQFACFDTAFHHTLPELERRLPLPQAWHEKGLQRYGFHGLSYHYIASVLPQHLGKKADGRVIVAHLGNGSSACGMIKRKSRATTMGFSTLDGLMMGTRTGALDPGAILYLLQQENYSVPEIENLLYKESGLKGISGLSNDVRELLASRDPRAKLALELYSHLAARQIASLTAAIGGMDALVFTGGIGEHASLVREAICSHLKWIPGADIAVIPTDEEHVIAEACAALM